MMQQLTIIKVGGKVVEEAESLNELLNDFVQLPGLKLLVHGGGRSATKISERLGIETTMVKGRRVTDAETLKVVTMVYAGLVNKTIVASLQARGCNAVGLTGADMDLIRSKKRVGGEVDYGFVGDVVAVQTQQIAQLIADGVIPVVAPITHDGNGQLLNTNADTMASALATALAAVFEVSLVYCFEKPGVMMDQNDELSVIPMLDKNAFQKLTADGVIVEGMIPKLDNGFAAIDAGVRKVVITNIEGMKGGHLGGTALI
ncbi:N-acetylglutamate kinase [Breznakibacter xylanolyticus]|uniref:Acetylglutamate kinase n=1 Tax=Breznakibacter xylanolyticus TaxID=990 RepID=A0A2W7NBV9_9BACT|nr:acetylglutamate kinase [Breznakibacter xylanolyticus]PZX17470.1 N-acetylglutamate kinase [Breznakibacter xylanolyticus]